MKPLCFALGRFLPKEEFPSGVVGVFREVCACRLGREEEEGQEARPNVHREGELGPAAPCVGPRAGHETGGAQAARSSRTLALEASASSSKSEALKLGLGSSFATQNVSFDFFFF